MFALQKRAFSQLSARAASVVVLCLATGGTLPAVAALAPSQLTGVVDVVYAASGGTPVTCTGVLVGAHTVLTAAHCGAPDGNPATMPSVQFFAESGPPLSVSVATSTINPTYNSSTQFGDLQVLTLGQVAPTGAQIYSIYGATVEAGQSAVTVGTMSGVNAVQIDSISGSSWLANGSGVTDGDSGGPLFGLLGGQATLLGNVTFGADTGAGSVGFDGLFDVLGGTLFQDFIAFIEGVNDDVITVITGVLDNSSPPPPPPPPPDQYVLVTTQPDLTVFGADSTACTQAFLSGEPCPAFLTQSQAFQNAADGYVMFNAVYGTLDEAADFDPAGFFIGDELFEVFSGSGSDEQREIDYRFDVAAGVPYGFYVDSIDQGFGAAELKVSNIRVFAEVFNPSRDIPEPASLALAGLAMVVLFVSRRRLRNNR